MTNRLQNPTPEQGQTWFVDAIPHNQASGMRFVQSGVGRLVLDLPYQERLIGDPDTGVMHGGAITVLIDATSGGAVLAKFDVPHRIATLDLRIDYLRPARAGRTVRCEATCYRLTQHVAFTRAIAHDGDPDDEVATAAGTFIVFRDEIPPSRGGGS